MIRSPKEKFQSAELVRAEFEAISQTRAFEEALNASMLQMALELPDNPLAMAPQDGHNQMIGARKLAEILCHIHVKEIAPKRTDRRLDPMAGI